MTKSYFNIREALEIGTDEIVDAYKKATPGEVKEEDDAPASPDEAGMAMDQAKFIGYVADEIMEYIQGNNEFPEWMQNKLSALHEKAKGMHAVMAGKYESVKEENLQELDAKTQKKFSMGAKNIKAYAQKSGGIDKKDFMDVAKLLDQISSVNLLQAGQLLSRLNRLVDGMDTDVRERIYAELRKVGLVESVQEAKVECPKCKGEGCDHCDGKGYHMTEAKQKNWIVTVVKPINKLKKGMKVIVPARNTAEAMKKALKKMGENPAAIGSGHIDVKLDEELEEKYRAPTKAEIEADKKKDQKGKSRPSISAKSVNKKQYSNMMGRLKEEELDEMNPYKNHPKNKLKAKQASFNRQIGDLQTKKLKGAKNPSIDQEIAKYQQKLRQVKSAMESRFGGLEEKLQVSDGMAKWIEDFQKSDAPQFVEKDKNERREMAIAAYLAAKRKSKKED